MTTSPNSSFPNKPLRILLLDPLPQKAQLAFNQFNCTVIIKTHFKIDECFAELSEAELCEKISDYNIVCVQKDRQTLYLTDEVIKSAHRLLAIGIFTRNTRQVDLVTAQEMGIPVFSAPYQHQNSIGKTITL